MARTARVLLGDAISAKDDMELYRWIQPYSTCSLLIYCYTKLMYHLYYRSLTEGVSYFCLSIHPLRSLCIVLLCHCLVRVDSTMGFWFVNFPLCHRTQCGKKLRCKLVGWRTLLTSSSGILWSSGLHLPCVLLAQTLIQFTILSAWVTRYVHQKSTAQSIAAFPIPSITSA